MTVLLTALAAALTLALPAAAHAATGQILYAADGDHGNRADLLVLDAQSGRVAKTIGPTGFAIAGLARDPTTGILYASTSTADVRLPGYLLKIDPATGAATPIGDLVPPATNFNEASDIAFTPDGTLYGWIEGPDDLARIDKTTGLATIVGNAGISTSNTGLASNPSGVLFLSPHGDTGSMYTVDPATGAVTPAVTLQGVQGFSINGLAFDGAGALFGTRRNTAASFGELITITPADGVVAGKGQGLAELDTIAFAPKPQRTLRLRVKSKAGKHRVKLIGRIVAPGAEGACIAGERVTLQTKRRKGKLHKVGSVTVGSSGRFGKRVRRAGKYIATVPESPACGSARDAA
jgi:hypothetical protein